MTMANAPSQAKQSGDNGNKNSNANAANSPKAVAKDETVSII